MMRRLRGQSGSVLIASLVTIVVLLTMFLAVFTYSMARYSVHVKSQYEIKAGYLAETGINRAIFLLDRGELDFDKLQIDSLKIPLGELGQVVVTCRPFGAYNLLISRGISGGQQTVFRTIIGTAPIRAIKNAITLTDPRYPLTVTGTTIIKGDVLTGPKGIATGEIEGRGIVNDSFHIGRHFIADTVPVDPVSTTAFDEYLEFARSERQSEKEISGSLVLEEGDESLLNDNYHITVDGSLDINGLRWKTDGPVRTIHVRGPITMRGNSRLDGLLEFLGDKYISISDSAEFAGGIVYAKDSVVLRGNCYFVGQGIAQHGLFVREDAQIAYPSTLVMAPDDASPDEKIPSMVLGSRRQISAICMLVTDPGEYASPSERIFVDSVSRVEGVVFSSAYIEDHGTVFGSVVTNNFYYEFPPTVYINWLRDTKIDRDRLSWSPILPLIFQGKGNFGVFSQRRSDG